MSETPERKVLKETLARLKTKNITSLNSYKTDVKTVLDRYRTFTDTQFKDFSKLNETQRTALQMLTYIINDFERVLMNSLDTMDSLSLYSDMLEGYSTQLDETLSSIFEKAKKYAEEKTKEQEQLIKKDSSSSYVK